MNNLKSIVPWHKLPDIILLFRTLEDLMLYEYRLEEVCTGSPNRPTNLVAILQKITSEAQPDLCTWFTDRHIGRFTAQCPLRFLSLISAKIG